MNRLQWIVVLAALSWALVLSPFFVSHALAAPTCADLAGDARYQPRPCPTQVCELSGPGGCIRDWQLAVQLDVLAQKTIHVPAKMCASACIIAVGWALQFGGHVTIDSNAKLIWPHSRARFAQYPMPEWFRAKVEVL